MGKRRTVFEHKDPRAMNDDDDDDEDENDADLIVEEPPSQEQLESIKQRKKLVPKRKLGLATNNNNASATTIPSDSPFASLKPFPITTVGSSSNEANSDGGDKPSIFSGFKGFTGFKPLETTTTTTTTSTSSSTTTNTNNNSAPKPFSFIPSSNLLPATPKSSSTIVANGSSSQSGDKTTAPSITLASSQKRDEVETSSGSGGGDAGKNVNEMEMRFITGLNELYERCYGESMPKRHYKLPTVDALETTTAAGKNGSSDLADQVEAKYASLLAELNRNCSRWISKHVEESPYVILTPVFVDYFNYLILLEKSFYPETFKQQPQPQQQQQQAAKSSLTTVLNGDTTSGHLNGHKDHSLKNDFFKTMSSEKKSSSGEETNKPTTSTTTTTKTSNQMGIFKFGAATAAETPETKKPVPTLSQSTLNSNAAAAETSSKESSNLPSLASTAMTTPVFKFGADNAANSNTLKLGGPTLLGSKPSEASTASQQASSSLSSSSENKPSPSPATFFSLLNKTDSKTTTTNSSNESSTTTTLKPFSLSSSSTTTSLSPFAASSLTSSSSTTSSTLTTATTTAAPTATTTTTTPLFSFGNNNQTSAATTTTTTLPTFLGFGSGTTGFGSAGSVAKSGLFSNSSSLFANSSSTILGGGGSDGTAAATADADDDKEEYQPPKPESSDVKEDGAVFTKRIKLYYFNDKEKKFADRGIGNIFIKPVQQNKEGEPTSSSYQLVVRADNKLAQILLNVKLSSVFPVKRDGPKDVSYVCLPNPPIQNLDSNVPCKFLFKVKTENDAAELLDKLNEYKK